MPPSVPSAMTESSGPVFGRVPPESVPVPLPVEPVEPVDPLEPEEPPDEPPAPVTSSVSDGPGLLVGVHVVVVPRALMVSTAAVNVTLPDAFGVYVPVRSLILMGVLAGIAASFAYPDTETVPLSAPPTLMVALGLIAPLPSSTGLEETPFCQDIVSL